MKVWILKAIVQKVISFLPFSHKVNYLFQKFVTRGIRLTDELFIDKLTHFRNHYHYYLKYRDKIEGKAILEIGTGWYPIIPILFFGR